MMRHLSWRAMQSHAATGVAAVVCLIGSACADASSPASTLAPRTPSVDRRTPTFEYETIDEALERLAAIDLDQVRIVEMRFFAGLTVDETAHVLGRSPRTVKREWQLAKAWLFRELRQER